MALEVQPPSDRKRVKVYELKDNDWFDRGTGFCTGQILDVSPGRRPCVWPLRDLRRPLLGRKHCGSQARVPSIQLAVANTPLFVPRMNRGYSSSRRMSLIVCSWRPKSPRMTAIRNNKVRCPLRLFLHRTQRARSQNAS